MSIVYRIDDVLGATFVVWDAHVTADVYLTHLRKMTADPAWPTTKRLQLGDLRSASVDPSVDRRVLETAAALFTRHPEKIARMKVAVVAGQAMEQTEILRELTYPVASAQEASIIWFNVLSDACIWLGIPVEEAERVLSGLRAQARGEFAPGGQSSNR